MRAPWAVKRWVPLAVLAVLALSLFPPGLRLVYGASSGQSASTVIGEPNFVTSVNPSSAFKIPSNFLFDAAGDIWISDSGNNRIIEMPSPVLGGNVQFQNVLGQSSYTTGNAATSKDGISNPSGMAFDPYGDLWVADTNNNRVLEYEHPFTEGENAGVVLGQSSFTSDAPSSSPTGLNLPATVLFDSSGDLWVVDAGNNRILEYAAPFTSGMSPTLVIGQANLNSSSSGASPTGLFYPTSAVFDSGNLWVADSGNNRVLEFTAPFSSGMAASLVIGQANLASATAATTQSGLSFPDGLAFDSSGDLWVADAYNNRVLEYASPLTTGMAASVVLGQPSYTTSFSEISAVGLDTPSQVSFGPNGYLWVADSYNNRLVEFAPPFVSGSDVYWEIGQNGYTSSVYEGATSLYGPESMAFDSSGDLWTTDTQDNRVLEYATPLVTGMSAGLAIGQANLTRSLGATSGDGLDYPYDLVFDSHGDLWVSDSNNNRVLEYTPPFNMGMNASLVLGQPSFSTDYETASPSGMYYPTGIAFDASGDLWVSDTLNNRILEFKPPFFSDMSASVVLGQNSFGTSTPGTSSGQLYVPIGLGFDPLGDLWVADAYNNRVLEFTSPLSSGEGASLVVGQSGFTTGLPATSQVGLYLPSDVAFDKAGDLWVSDSGNSRALEYTKPFTQGMGATVAIGQPNFISDAPATSATGLSNPLGIAFDSAGDLWVADSNNNRLLEFQAGSSSSSGTSTTSGVVTLSVSTSSTPTPGASSTSTKTTTSSTVPEFPLGAPLVLASALFATLILASALRRRNPTD